MMEGGTGNRSPSVKLLIRPIVSPLQGLRPQFGGLIDDVSRIVKIPISRQHASLPHHARMQLRSRIRRLNMKRRGGDTLLNGPIYRAPEHVFAVIIHSEDEAPIDHDAERVHAVRNGLVVAAEFVPP